MLPKSALSLTAILLLSVTSLHAIKFETLGYKSISMGGAAVATSSGSLASYNNPALLAKQPYNVEVSVGAGVGLYDEGAAAALQQLDELSYFDTLDKAAENVNSLSTQEKQSLNDGSKVLLNMDGKALTLVPQAHLSAQVYNFGFGVFSGSDSAVTSIVDQDHDQLYFDNNGNYVDIDNNAVTQQAYETSAIEYALKNGQTYLDVKGMGIIEVPLAYGHNFETKIGNIMVGGAIKYMHAITYKEKIEFTDDETNPTVDEKQDRQSSNVGVDIGLAYQPIFAYDLTFGLVAKNLNSPSFDYYDGSSVSVDPLIRAGVAYKIFDSLEVAADLDLTSNSVLNENIESQMVGGGLNFEPFSNFFALSLRAGLMQNLHNNDKAGLIYTAGLGIGVKWIQLDLSGEMSGNQNTVQDVTIPQYTKVNLALVSRW